MFFSHIILTTFFLPFITIVIIKHFCHVAASFDVSLFPFSLSSRSIQRILKYPPTRTLSGDERQLLWKFRFSLMSEKRALTKFLRCVEWSDVQVNLILSWKLINRWYLVSY